MDLFCFLDFLLKRCIRTQIFITNHKHTVRQIVTELNMYVSAFHSSGWLLQRLDGWTVFPTFLEGLSN